MVESCCNPSVWEAGGKETQAPETILGYTEFKANLGYVGSFLKQGREPPVVHSCVF